MPVKIKNKDNNIFIIYFNYPKWNTILTGKRFFNNGESPNGAETRAKICWCTGTKPFVLVWLETILKCKYLFNLCTYNYKYAQTYTHIFGEST